MELLAMKIFLAPLCVVAVTLAGRRWGIEVAGVLGGLPVVAGPILLVETLLHGRGYGSHAAAGTLLALAPLAAFQVVYGRVAPALSPVSTLLCGWAAFVLGVVVLNPVRPPIVISLAFVVCCFLVSLRLLPGAVAAPIATTPASWDLPARAIAAFVLVLVLTAVSGALGPHLSGLLAAFPVITSILAVFTHAHLGVAAVQRLVRSFIYGFFGFATFCFTLSLALSALAILPAFGVAVAAALALQASLVAVRAARSPIPAS